MSATWDSSRRYKADERTQAPYRNASRLRAEDRIRRELAQASGHPSLGGSTSNWWPYNGGDHPMWGASCDSSKGMSGGSLIDQATGYSLGVYS